MSEKGLREDLKSLYHSLRADALAKWNRDLPVSELLFDRWERARLLGFGEGASIYHSSYVYGDVHVGKKTWIGPFTILEGTGGIAIGAFCSISAGVHIYTHDSVHWAVSGGRAAYQQAAVTIGNNCYIGAQTVISKGVSIGDCCVIGACSFVNRNIPPNSVAVGVPCRVIGAVEIIEPAGEVVLRYQGNDGLQAGPEQQIDACPEGQ